MLDITPAKIQIFFALSVLLSLPTIILGENILFTLPLLLIILLSIIFGEKFIIAIILISLFTLVGELNRSLRVIVQFIDFTLLGILFLKQFGLDFQAYPKVPKSVVYFLILYFSAMIISSVISDYPFAGIGIITRQLAFFIIVYIFYSLIVNSKYIILFFTSINFVSVILVTFSLISILQGNVSLLDFLTPNRPRVSAIITNTEASTNFFIISFPILITTLLLKNKFIEKRLQYFLILYISIGLIFTMSRSAILGIILSSGIIFFVINRKRFYQLLFSLAVLILLFIFFQPLNELLTTFLRIESGMSARDYIWKMSIDMIEDHTIFGIGPGAYQFEMLNYFPYMLDNWWGKIFIYYQEVTEGANLSHNFFLTLFTDMGILGIITAIVLPVIYFRIGIQTLNKYRNGSIETYYLITALFAGGTSIIVRNLFNSIGLIYVGGIHTDLPFWMIFSSLIYFNQNSNGNGELISSYETSHQ